MRDLGGGCKRLGGIVGIEVFVAPLFDGSYEGVGLVVGLPLLRMIEIYCYDWVSQ